MDSACRWRRSASAVVAVVAVLRAGVTEGRGRFSQRFFAVLWKADITFYEFER